MIFIFVLIVNIHNNMNLNVDIGVELDISVLLGISYNFPNKNSIENKVLYKTTIENTICLKTKYRPTLFWTYLIIKISSQNYSDINRFCEIFVQFCSK